MPKTRALDPETWIDGDLGALSRDARLLAIAMITLLADDCGRFKADPREIKLKVFGYDDDIDAIRVSELMQEIAEKCSNFVSYRVGGRDYFMLNKFAEKQHIRWVTKSVIPPISEADTVNSLKIKDCGNLPKSPEVRGRVEKSRVEKSRVEVEKTSSANAASRGEADAKEKPSRKPNPQAEKVGEILESLTEANVAVLPTPARVGKWISHYGEPLLWEFLREWGPSGKLADKSADYIQSVLEARKASAGKQQSFLTVSKSAPIPPEVDRAARRADYEKYLVAYREWVEEYGPTKTLDEKRAFQRARDVPWVYFEELEQEFFEELGPIELEGEEVPS